jgi:hypothetical protein
MSSFFRGKRVRHPPAVLPLDVLKASLRAPTNRREELRKLMFASELPIASLARSRLTCRPAGAAIWCT